ncbi:MAG TPA: RNA-binding protein [Lentzea sp.]
MFQYVYQVTKYDPDDYDERGHYAGPEDVMSDHGPVEAAYLAAVAVFAEHLGVTELTIREPGITGFVNFGLEAPIPGYGLAGLFPPDLTGFHDGARAPVATAQALVRVMLRDNGAWCRLEVDGRLGIQIDYDQYMHVGLAEPCDEALTRVEALGLFPWLVDGERRGLWPEDLSRPRAADDEFWAEVDRLVVDRGSVMLEERYIGNGTRWRRLLAADVNRIRATLGPRSELFVWPEFNDDVVAELRTLEEHDFAVVVWEDRDGRITELRAGDDDYPTVVVHLAKAKSAMVLSNVYGVSKPLLAAVLPDDDGVVRVRWSDQC